MQTLVHTTVMAARWHFKHVAQVTLKHMPTILVYHIMQRDIYTR